MIVSAIGDHIRMPSILPFSAGTPFAALDFLAPDETSNLHVVQFFNAQLLAHLDFRFWK